MKRILILPLIIAPIFMTSCAKVNGLQSTAHSIDSALSALSNPYNHSSRYNSTITRKNIAERALVKDAPVALINNFISKLLIPNTRQSAHAIMPLMHKSTYAKNRKNLDGEILEYSFKKAHQNAKFYRYPVKIIRASKTNVTALGHKSRGTAEAGHEINYYLAKKPGVGGVPAPLTVFFPSNGGAPTISSMGSL